MTRIKSYHRPETVEAALDLLARPGIATAVLAGGTQLNARKLEGVDEVVDLQAVGLDGIHRAGDRLLLGAMTRPQAIVEAEEVPALVRETAHREGPNTFRNQGALGGVIVDADPESELLAALLVCEAGVTVQTLAGTSTMPLSDFLADVTGSVEGGIITEISLATDGETASERVARTPADKPIVAAVGRKTADGRVLLALCGVADTPILVEPDQPASLDPPADFRGSSEYRREMAVVLSERVVAHLN